MEIMYNLIICILAMKVISCIFRENYHKETVNNYKRLLDEEISYRINLDERFMEYRNEMLDRGYSALEIDERILDLRLKEIEYYREVRKVG